MLMLAGFLVTLGAILFVLVSLMLILLILIQKPRGGGLAGAFGGAGGMAQTAFGAKVGDVLTWATCVFFAVFLLLAMGLTWGTGSAGADSTATVESGSSTPATPGTPVPAPSPAPATPVQELPPLQGQLTPPAPPSTQPQP